MTVMPIARVLVGFVAIVAVATSASTASAEGLNAFRVKATAKNVRALAESGFDVTEGHDPKRGTIEVVGYRSQVGKLKAKELTDFRAVADPLAASPIDGASDAAWAVWTKYDAVPDDGKEQFTETSRRLTADHPDIVASRAFGRTYGGRAIVDSK